MWCEGNMRVSEEYEDETDKLAGLYKSKHSINCLQIPEITKHKIYLFFYNKYIFFQNILQTVASDFRNKDQTWIGSNLLSSN